MSKTTVFLLLVVFGLFQNQAKIKHWLNPPPPREPGSYKVVLYSTTWCGYCAKTRRYFADNNIEYQDLDVEKTEAGKAAYQKLGADGVPIIVVNDNAIIRGYAPDEIESALAAE